MIDKNNNKKNGKKLLFTIIFILGFLIFLYPIASNVVHSMNQTRLVYDYNKELKKLEDREKEKKRKEAEEYNNDMNTGIIDIKDPYAKDKEDETDIQDEVDERYISALNINEMMGNIEIPKLGVDIPIYHGTSERILQKGVGHIEGSSLPIGGIGTHTALTAHRGLPSSRLFRNLDELEEGDTFFIHTLEETLAYEVDNIDIVLPWETEKINIDENKDYATLVTCEPYMINTHRLLVRGTRVPYIENKPKTNLFHKYRDFVILGLAIIICTILFIKKKRHRDEAKSKA